MLQLSGRTSYGPAEVTAHIFRSFWITKKGTVVVVTTKVSSEGKATEEFTYLDQENQCSGSINPNYAWGPGAGWEQ